ncbi:MAG: 50S ribosomal protein L9 [Rhabdochlamydiaceae bacterium]|nr:50S ribosomal protein L9 [Rhabdochlamydiaceae bacterium]
MGNQLLLLEDVEDLGRSGDLVSVKPGYARNFLLPQKKAVVADKYTLRLQARLKEERAKQAEIDRKDSEDLARQIDGAVIIMQVKVDPDGHMYGSVTALDIVRHFDAQGIKLEKRSVLLASPIKSTGVYPLNLKLKEGVPALVTLKVFSEAQIAADALAQQNPAESSQEEMS